MEESKWQDAEEGALIVGKVLMKEASLVDSIAEQLEEAEGRIPALQTAQGKPLKSRKELKQQAGR